MRKLFPVLLALALGLTSCQPAQQEGATVPKSPGNSVYSKDSTYCRLEILDPGFDHMVAFTLNVPRDWMVEQTLQREWFGTAPRISIRIMLRSPDGWQQIDYFPSEQYVYTEPVATFRDQAPAHKRPPSNPPPDPVLAAMTPAIYLRTRLLPMLATQEQALRDTSNFRQPRARLENGRPETSASLDGTLPNGRRARAEVRLSRQSSNNGSTIYHMWSAVPSLTQAAGNLAATYAHTQAAQQSIVPNPEWQRLANEPVADTLPRFHFDRHRITNWHRLPPSNTRLYYQYREMMRQYEDSERRDMQPNQRFRPEAP